MRLRFLVAALCMVLTVLPAANAQQVQAEVKRKLVSKIAPLYPEIARRMQLSGTVKLQVEIQPNGFAGSTKIIGGHPMLAQSAIDAVNKWKWAPAGQSTTEVVEINFSPQN